MTKLHTLYDRHLEELGTLVIGFMALERQNAEIDEVQAARLKTLAISATLTAQRLEDQMNAILAAKGAVDVRPTQYGRRPLLQNINRIAIDASHEVRQ